MSDTGQFSSEIVRFQDSSKELRYAIIATHAAILGITVSLLGYNAGAVNEWLFATWILQLSTIALGFVTVKVSIDEQFAESSRAYRFSMDMQDIEGRVKEHTNDPDKLTGMLIAAFRDRTEALSRNKPSFSKKALQLAEKYKHELWSRQFLIEGESPRPRVINWLASHFSLLLGLFYTFAFSAFVTMALGVILQHGWWQSLIVVARKFSGLS